MAPSGQFVFTAKPLKLPRPPPSALHPLHEIIQLKWLTEIAFGDLRFKMK